MKKIKRIFWLSIKFTIIFIVLSVVFDFVAEINTAVSYLQKDKYVMIMTEVLAVLGIWKITKTKWKWWVKLLTVLLVVIVLSKIITVFPEYRFYKDEEMCHEGKICRQGIVLEDDYGKKYSVDEKICNEYNGRWMTEYQACDFNPPQP
ncbi:MAG: hypothetical protein J6K16_00615 [Alphaproteobacteria bacterium]|nr:hypothetical protein [Alphaproteobacteria bacterium]